MIEQYSVIGMSCAACSQRVEKAVKKVDGVKECTISLLTNSMAVEGNAMPDDVILAVEKAGYSASLKTSSKTASYNAENKNQSSKQEDYLADKQTPLLKKRLISSVFFLVILMYVSMGHMMFNWPLPEFFKDNHIAMGLTQMLLTIIIMVINQKFFISGFKGLINKAPNMDSLVALGALAAFLYSTYALFAMTRAQVDGNLELVIKYMHEFYFESAGTILTLITVGKTLESKSKGKTTNALKGLMNLSPKKANIIIDGIEKSVDILEVKKGDIFVVRPGEAIPCDGTIIEGNSAINEASLTGESIPVDKNPGDFVSAATINQSGFITCQALRVGEDTTLSQIIKMVSDAAATKAPIARIADKVSGVFVPIVISLAVITFIVWMLVGSGIGFAMARAVSVLVISCPCALGLATPVAIMVGNGVGAKNGILFKNAASLEATGKSKIVVLDKTGTITQGKPVVTDIVTAQKISNNKLLDIAVSLESLSEHPLAKAVIKYGNDKNIKPLKATDFIALPGNGLKANICGRKAIGGSISYITRNVTIPEDMKKQGDIFSSQGKTPLMFAENDRFLGIIAVADTIKEDSKEAIATLKDMGIKVVMLTGDNEKTANAIGSQAGVNEVIAGVLPDGKEQAIKAYKQKGKVIMVGDGINDAPALTRADVGIAIGAGSDIAIDAADIVLMKSRLSDVVTAIKLSKSTLRNIHENLFWAFFYNIIGIPLAAGVWIPLTHWKLNPMFAAAAMGLSSFCVVTNALRLNGFKIKKQEEKIMEKTIKIEGMMCGHCEARVKKTLEAIDGITNVRVSHEKGIAVIAVNDKVSDDEIKNAIEAQDYKVLSFSK